jgi:hypothetical protein
MILVGRASEDNAEWMGISGADCCCVLVREFVGSSSLVIAGRGKRASHHQQKKKGLDVLDEKGTNGTKTCCSVCEGHDAAVSLLVRWIDCIA